MTTECPLQNTALVRGVGRFRKRGFVSHSGCDGESASTACATCVANRIESVKSWLEISEHRLTDNYRVMTAVAGETAVLAVVKANAYGHGAAICASILARAGASWLGLTDVAEG